MVKGDFIVVHLSSLGDRETSFQTHPTRVGLQSITISEYFQRVIIYYTVLLSAVEFLGAGGHPWSGFQHIHWVQVRTVLSAPGVPVGFRCVEVDYGDLIPPRQELGVRRWVHAWQEGPLCLAKADQEVVLRRVIDVITIF